MVEDGGREQEDRVEGIRSHLSEPGIIGCSGTCHRHSPANSCFSLSLSDPTLSSTRMSKPALWARPLGLTRRPFCSSPFLLLPRPTQPSRPPSSGLPPPLPRTPIGRITPLRVPASSLPPTTPPPEQDEQEAERALLRRTFETTDFAQLRPTVWRPVLVRFPSLSFSPTLSQLLLTSLAWCVASGPSSSPARYSQQQPI